MPYCRCWIRSKRSRSRLHLSSRAKVRSTRIRNAWMAALNQRFRPRLGCLRFRGFSGMLGRAGRCWGLCRYRDLVWSTNSCGFARGVLQEPPKPFTTLHRALARRIRADRRKEEHIVLALMVPLVMKMRHILRQCVAERRFPKQDKSRQALLFDGAHPALRVGVQIRRLRWQWDPRDPSCVNDLLKGWAIFSVPIMDQVLPGRQATPILHRDVARHLHHPGFIRMWCHPRDLDLSAPQMDEEEDVVRHQPPQRPDLSGEKVRRDQHLHMRADELFPRRGGLALWRRGEAMALQDVAHRLVTEGVPEIGQGADNAIIPPGTILLRHAHHQVLHFLGDRGATGRLALLRAVK